MFHGIAFLSIRLFAPIIFVNYLLCFTQAAKDRRFLLLRCDDFSCFGRSHRFHFSLRSSFLVRRRKLDTHDTQVLQFLR